MEGYEHVFTHGCTHTHTHRVQTISDTFISHLKAHQWILFKHTHAQEHIRSSSTWMHTNTCWSEGSIFPIIVGQRDTHTHTHTHAERCLSDTYTNIQLHAQSFRSKQGGKANSRALIVARTVTRICAELINRVDNKKFQPAFIRWKISARHVNPPSDVMDVPPSPQLRNTNILNLKCI